MKKITSLLIFFLIFGIQGYSKSEGSIPLNETANSSTDGDYKTSMADPCDPPGAMLSNIIFDCQNNYFFIQLNVVDLGNGTPSVTDGITVWPITATGNIQIGPFNFATPNTLLLQHGADSSCNITLGTIFIPGCPPENDNCANAIPLTVAANYTSGIVNASNNFASSSNETNSSCDGFAGGDIWYSVVVPDSGNITIQTGQTSTGGTTLFDSVVSIYTGSCGSLVPIGCDDDGAGIAFYSLKSVTGQIPGSTLYVRVYEFNNDHIDNFGIAAYDASLSNGSFEKPDVTVYPNPVKDVLNLSSESVISDITLFNMLGQKVFEKYVYGTQLQVDISSLSSGHYVVKIATRDSIKTLKIVKSN